MIIKIPDNKGFKKDIVDKYAANNVKLKIGIIDADLLDGGTRHPNLALLKISSYCKKKNHIVELIKRYEDICFDYGTIFEEINPDCYDLLILSKVFKFTKIPLFIQRAIDNNFIYYGGTGFITSDDHHLFLDEIIPNLEDDVEYIKPDYTLYLDYIDYITKGNEKKKKRDWDDYLSYSIGFTTRGCIRHCAFCVNRLSTGVTKWSKVDDFYDESKPKIYLWDDNIMAAGPKIFEEIILELKEKNKPFQFRQGMDIRLMTARKAKLLNTVKYYGDFIYAFDHYGMINQEKKHAKELGINYKDLDPDIIKERKQVVETIKGLKVWRKYSSKSTKLYVLVAFDSQDEKDIEGTFWRIKILMRFGCLPYIMRFEEYTNSRFKNMYTQIARWCNQPGFFKKMSFRQYCVRNEEFHQGIQYDTPKGVYHTKLTYPEGFIPKQKHCSCYQAMIDFEEEFPDIAEEYFDLRFEELNRYKQND